MKKYLLCFIMCLFLAGCATDTNTSDGGNSDVAHYDNCHLELLENAYSFEENGESYIRVKAMYQNDGSEPLYAYSSFNVRAFQDNEQIEDCSDINGSEKDLIKEVKEHQRMEVSYLFKLVSDAPVEVIIGTPTAEIDTIGKKTYDVNVNNVSFIEESLNVISVEELQQYVQTIEVTTDNWQDFYEVVEKSFNETDVFGDPTGEGIFSKSYILKQECVADENFAIKIQCVYKQQDNHYSDKDELYATIVGEELDNHEAVYSAYDSIPIYEIRNYEISFDDVKVDESNQEISTHISRGEMEFFYSNHTALRVQGKITLFNIPEGKWNIDSEKGKYLVIEQFNKDDADCYYFCYLELGKNEFIEYGENHGSYGENIYSFIANELEYYNESLESDVKNN